MDRPTAGESAIRRVRSEILDALRGGQEVLVLAFADNTEQRIGPFRVNIPAALEDDIIAQLRPPWNGGRRISEALSSANTPDTAPSEQTNATANSQPQTTLSRPTFGKTYYRQGFFNVPVALADHFAKP